MGSQLAQRATEDLSCRETLGNGTKQMPQSDSAQRARKLAIYTPSLSAEVALPHFVTGDVFSYLSAGLGRRSLSDDARRRQLEVLGAQV